MRTEQASSSRYLIGNWKCNKNLSQAVSWLNDFIDVYKPVTDLEVIVAPPTIILAQLAEHLKALEVPHISLAAQDLSPFPPGSYTGAIAADMLSSVADYAIVGHSERRRYFHETSQDVTNKVSEAADAGITPIICVDKSFAMSQLTSLLDIDCDRLIIAYSPVDALSYRAPEPVEMVSEAVSFISGIYPNQPIIYGGSISAKNAGQYADIAGTAGLFVGAASLDPHTFNDIHQKMSVSL